MQETRKKWVWSLGQENSLEEGIATHSSVLAWEIPWSEEPGGLHPWGRKESDMLSERAPAQEVSPENPLE